MELKMKLFPTGAVTYEDPARPNTYFCQQCWDDGKIETILQPDASQWKRTSLLCQKGHLPIKIL